MPLAIPNELKPITPFVRRAEELDKDSTRPESRLVAYYCRQYAVRIGIPLASTSSAAKTCLGHLLESLERDKKAMDTFTRPEAEFLCRQFAYGVFDRADGEDRADGSNKTTAKTFYTSASFLQMLEQFYEEEEVEGEQQQQPTEESREDKRRALYAKWKATEILKAIKEGRKPVSGGYTEHQDEQPEDEEGTGTKNDAPEQEDAPEDEKYTPPPPPPPVAQQQQQQQQQPDTPPPPPPPVTSVFESDEEEEAAPPPPAYPGPPAVPPPAPKPVAPPAPKPVPTPSPAPKSTGSWFGGGKKSSATSVQFADATELTKFALAALEERDADLAAQRLQEALTALGRTVARSGSSGRITNAHLADAMELTRFGASAIHDHDGDLAAERLEQALHCLGR